MDFAEAFCDEIVKIARKKRKASKGTSLPRSVGEGALYGGLGGAAVAAPFSAAAYGLLRKGFKGPPMPRGKAALKALRFLVQKGAAPPAFFGGIGGALAYPFRKKRRKNAWKKRSKMDL